MISPKPLDSPFIFGSELIELIKQRESFRVGVRTLLHSPLTNKTLRTVLQAELKRIEGEITMRQIAAEQKYLSANRLGGNKAG